MPTFEAELSDGRIVTLEADSQPTEQDILAAIGNQKPSATEALNQRTIGPLQSFLFEAAKGVAPTIGSAIGAGAGAAYGSELGPWGALGGGVVGALAGGWAGGEAQDQILKSYEPEFGKQVNELDIAARTQHPIASALGTLAAGVTGFQLNPGQTFRGLKALPAFLSRTASPAEQTAAKTLAAQVGVGAGIGAVNPLLHGQMPTAADVLTGAAYPLVFGQPRFGVGEPMPTRIGQAIPRQGPLSEEGPFRDFSFTDVTDAELARLLTAMKSERANEWKRETPDEAKLEWMSNVIAAIKRGLKSRRVTVDEQEPSVETAAQSEDAVPETRRLTFGTRALSEPPSETTPSPEPPVEPPLLPGGSPRALPAPTPTSVTTARQTEMDAENSALEDALSKQAETVPPIDTTTGLVETVTPEGETPIDKAIATKPSTAETGKVLPTEAPTTATVSQAEGGVAASPTPSAMPEISTAKVEKQPTEEPIPPSIQFEHPSKGTTEAEAITAARDKADAEYIAISDKLTKAEEDAKKAGPATKRREQLEAKAQKLREQLWEIGKKNKSIKDSSREMYWEHLIQEGDWAQKWGATVELLKARAERLQKYSESLRDQYDKRKEADDAYFQARQLGEQARKISEQAYRLIQERVTKKLVELGATQEEAKAEAMNVANMQLSYPGMPAVHDAGNAMLRIKGERAKAKIESEADALMKKFGVLHDDRFRNRLRQVLPNEERAREIIEETRKQYVEEKKEQERKEKAAQKKAAEEQASQLEEARRLQTAGKLHWVWVGDDKASYWKPVEGKTVKVPEDPKHEYFVYKAGTARWSLTEASTGLQIGQGSTQGEALQMARDRIKSRQDYSDLVSEHASKRPSKPNIDQPPPTETAGEKPNVRAMRPIPPSMGEEVLPPSVEDVRAQRARDEISTAGKTTIQRGDTLSAPTQWIVDNLGIPRAGETVLHFGSGRDHATTRLLGSEGAEVSEYDPNYAPDRSVLDHEYDLVVSNFVLNVLPPNIRDSAYRDIKRTIGKNGVGILSVRAAGDKSIKGYPEFDGVRTSKGTFQIGYTVEHFRNELAQHFGSVEILKGSDKSTSITARVAEPKGEMRPGAKNVKRSPQALGIIPPGTPNLEAIRMAAEQAFEKAKVKLRNTRATLRSYSTSKPLRELATYTKDVASNQAHLAAKQLSNDLRGSVRRALNRPLPPAPIGNARTEWERQQDMDQAALNIVVESGRDLNQVQHFENLVRSSTTANRFWKEYYLRAIEHARANWTELQAPAQQYAAYMHQEWQNEIAHGIEVIWRDNYVPHAQDLPNEFGFLGDPSGEGTSGFRHARAFRNNAESIAAGVDPITLNAADVAQARIASGQMLINNREWLNIFRRIQFNGRPIVGEFEVVHRRPPLPADRRTPAGYTNVQIGVQHVPILDEFSNLFQALSQPSWFRGHFGWNVLLKAAAGGKHFTLMLDTFHLGRIAAWEMAIKPLSFTELGEGIAKALQGDFQTIKKLLPIPSYEKGGLMVDYSANELTNMAARGEIDPSILPELLAAKSDLQRLIWAGYNIGKITDVLHQHWVQAIPVTGRFNKWLFDQFVRGAMVEVGLIELQRYRRMYPNLSQEEIARRVAKDLNVRFGNLGRQGILKSRTMQDIGAMLFLAQQWNEALIRSETGAVTGALRGVKDTVKNRRLQFGVLPRATGAMAVGIFLMGQIINYITRGKPTWENPEEGAFGPKISGYIPDVVGGGPGFFLNPMSLPLEITHLLSGKYENTKSYRNAVLSYLGSRQSTLMRPGTLAITGRDAMGRNIPPDDLAWETFKQSIPLPIGGSAAWQAGQELISEDSQELYQGQYQKQLMASIGMKTDQAPSPERRIQNLAREFNRKHDIQPSAEFYTGTYSKMISALRIGNITQAIKEYRDILGRKVNKKTPEDVVKHMLAWPNHPYTGNSDRENEMYEGLSDEQKATYAKARQDRVDLVQRFFQMLDKLAVETEGK